MNPNRQLFFYNLTTATALLRRVARVNQHHLATSLYRFVAKQVLEQPQPSIVRHRDR